VLVRNCDGELRAFQNVCAHRHSLLTALRKGRAPRIRCQVHGWEYDADGKSLRVPDARSFVPIRRGGECLRRFRVATCGQLVFVTLSETAPALRDALGERTWSVVETVFGAGYRQVAAWTLDHAANWKIPVENALESYHIPEVHRNTFRKLSDAREATHTLADDFTALEHRAPPSRVRWIAERWRRAPSHLYAHHHTFPSLLVAHTDLSSLAQIVLPVSPTTSRSFAFCFVHRGDGDTLVHRALAPVLARLVERYTREVLREDNVVFPSIQRGVRASTHAGVLGAREERVHAFQRYVDRALR
jgi:choline monooxygenase